MKRFLCVLLVLATIGIPGAIAESIDIDSMALMDLLELRSKVDAKLTSCLRHRSAFLKSIKENIWLEKTSPPDGICSPAIRTSTLSTMRILPIGYMPTKQHMKTLIVWPPTPSALAVL